MSLFRLSTARDALASGAYEDVVSHALAGSLDALRAAGTAVQTAPFEAADAHLLTRAVADATRLAFEGMTGEKAAEHRIALANALLDVIHRHAPADAFAPGETALRPEVLLSVLRAQGALAQIAAPPRPHTPLARCELFVNAERYGVVQELLSEIPSADGVDLICAFIKWTGLVKFREALARHCAAGKPLRVLTTTYLGATDARAIEELRHIGAEVRISFEETPTRLHAKAWLFRRATGLDTAYVGSSNLSRAALTDGIEWNVRIAGAELPHVIERFEAVFQRYWDDRSAGFVPYDGSPESRERLEGALQRARRRGAPMGSLGTVLEVEPRDFQRQILDDLDVARKVRGERNNLVVAATGTGKTVIAALDYRRLREAREADTLLFVAHRDEILRRSRQVFREVLRLPDFGELYVGGDRPVVGRHVFASIQSLAGVLRRAPPPPDAFDVVILDEVHHAAARTYRDLLGHVRPSVLVGLTATPERADDAVADALALEEWFPRPWAAELRLWEAIDRQILVPFNYFAVDDGMDLRKVQWRRGQGYDVRALGNVYDAQRIWVGQVARAVRHYVRDARDMRALAFCVDKRHAAAAAVALEEELGVPCRALTSDDTMDTRRELLAALASDAEDRPRVLCVVDLLNEGVDIPAVDAVLLMRPTQSATLFVQQIGRGLRRAARKECLTILDFIGVQHEEFRFTQRYQGLTGVRRGELRDAITEGFARLPAGCAIQLEERPRQQVLDSLRRGMRLVRGQLHRHLDPVADAELDLAAFLEHEGLELEDLYRDKRSWTSLRRMAGFRLPEPGEEEAAALQQVQRLVHVDDPWRLATLETLVTDGRLPADARDRRLAQALLAVLYPFAVASDLDAALPLFRSHAALRAEVATMLPVLRRRSRVSARAPSPHLPGEVPLHLHGRYRTEEIFAAFDVRTKDGRLYLPQAGVVPVGRFDVLLVTLDKSGRSKTPHLQYEDYALGPTRFHWQSQASTRRDSAKGRRHLDPGVVPLLFVRDADKDDRLLAGAYRFLGAARLVEARGERPMSIEWALLDGPMPAETLLRTRVAVG